MEIDAQVLKVLNEEILDFGSILSKARFEDVILKLNNKYYIGNVDEIQECIDFERSGDFSYETGYSEGFEITIMNLVRSGAVEKLGSEYYFKAGTKLLITTSYDESDITFQYGQPGNSFSMGTVVAFALVNGKKYQYPTMDLWLEGIDAEIIESKQVNELQVSDAEYHDDVMQGKAGYNPEFEVKEYDNWSIFPITDTGYHYLVTWIGKTVKDLASLEISKYDNGPTDNWVIWLNGSHIDIARGTSLESIVALVNAIDNVKQPLTVEMLKDLIELDNNVNESLRKVSEEHIDYTIHEKHAIVEALKTFIVSYVNDTKDLRDTYWNCNHVWQVADARTLLYLDFKAKKELEDAAISSFPVWSSVDEMPDYIVDEIVTTLIELSCDEDEKVEQVEHYYKGDITDRELVQYMMDHGMTWFKITSEDEFKPIA